MNRKRISKIIAACLASNLLFGNVSVLANDKSSVIEVQVNQEALENLALNKVAEASDSETENLGPANLVDGIVDRSSNKTRWSSNYNSNLPWISIDLGQATKFNEVKIEWERRNVTAYEIQGSNDNTNWTTIKTKGQPQEVTETISLGDQEYRYLKIQIKEYGADGLGGEISWKTVSMFEVEIYNNPNSGSGEGDVIPQGTNVALEKEALSSSVEVSTLGPENAFDGIVERDKKRTRWATNGSKPQWLSVDLGETKDIYNIVVEWERRNALEYRIQVSDDNSNWTDVYIKSSSPTNLRDVIELEEKATGRYVRLYINDFSSAIVDGIAWGNVSVYEMEVYDGSIPPEPEKPVKPQEIADNLVVNSPVKGQTKFEMPEVPAGYEINFIGANFEELIDSNLNIYEPLVDTKAILNFEIINQNEGASKGEKAVSKAYTVTVPGKYEVSGNDKPTIIPELSEWAGGEGNFEITTNSRLVIASEELREIANVIASDYEDITGNKIEIVVSSNPLAGDIFFKTSGKYPELREEGYFMTVEDYVEVEANTSDALFLASRTILQILKQNGTTIPQGLVRDYPEYDIRGLILDVGRKTFTMDFLEDITKTMSWYKMNDFQVHLNDNYIFLEEYGDKALTDAYTGFRLESSYRNNGQGLTSTDLFYTKEEFGNFIDESSIYGVNIVPEIDAPAHALSFTRLHPELAYGSSGRYAECLDVNNPAAVQLVQTVMDEYFQGDNPTFRNSTVHIGADEYKGPVEAYRSYVDQMLEYVQSKGNTVRVWGSLSEKNGTTPVRSEGIQMNVWNTGYSNPLDMYNLGYDIINSDDGQIYIVPAAGYYSDYLNSNSLFYNYEPNKFSNGNVLPAGSEQMKGGMFGVWNDAIDNRANGIVEYDVYDRMLPAIQVLGEKLWSSIENVSFEEWEETAEVLGTAPNSNPYYKVDSKTETVMNYDFTKVTGSTVTDKSGNDYNTTDSKNVVFNNGLNLNGGESFVKTPVGSIGSDYTISFTITRSESSSNEEQILFESPQGQFKAVQKETGKVGFSREGYDSSFDYELPKGETVELTIVGKMTKTELYVNGEYVDEISKTGSTQKIGTFVFPLETIGSEANAFEGTINNLKVVVEKEIVLEEELVIPQNQITATSPSGQDQPGDGIDKAFDGDKTTLWHSKWSTPNTFPMEGVMDLNGKYTIDTFTYLPRQTGSNGYVQSYEIQVSDDNGQTYKTVKTGSFTEDKKLKIVRFGAVEATHVKFISKSGVGGFTSAAEINIYRAKEEVEVVDKSALKFTIDYAEEIKAEGALDGIVPIVVKEFNEALEEAKSVYENEKATSVNVHEAFNRLSNAIHMLEFKQGNKEGLIKLVEMAGALKEDNYTSSSWANLIAELEKSNAVIADENAMQDEVDQAVNSLQAAIDSLELINVNKEALQNLVDRINALNKDQYIASTWANLETELANALNVLSNKDATQAEVDASYNTLMRAYLNLRLTPDKSKLEDLINSVNNMDLSKFTADSVNNLQLALAKANEVLGNEEATQEEVNVAINNLDKAKNSLVSSNDESKDEAVKPEENTGTNGNSNNGNNNNKLPQTGAATSSLTAVLLAAGAAISGMFMTKKKKED